jgi:hypothetical protein
MPKAGETRSIENADAGKSFRHRKRGTSYKVFGRAIVQTGKPLSDDQEVIVYVGSDGQIWVRPVDEFYDGRFEKIDIP